MNSVDEENFTLTMFKFFSFFFLEMMDCYTKEIMFFESFCNCGTHFQRSDRGRLLVIWFEEVSLDVEGQVAPLLEASAMADADGRV